MKQIQNFFPEIHVNPINRDLLVVITSGLLIAMIVVTIGVMIFGQL